jgi:hypothetical protein
MVKSAFRPSAWVLFLVILPPSAGFAQNLSPAFPVSGAVQDSNGAAIPGVQVMLRRNGVTLRTASTDVQGRFQFSRVPPGVYTLQACSRGFNPSSKVLRVGLSAPAPVTMVMTVASLHQQVTVTSSRNQVVPTTSDNLNGVTLNAQQINNLPVFDQDVVGLLSNFLDTDAGGTGGTGIVVNGVEVENLAVTPSAIKSIKIDHNPFDAQYRRPGWGRMEISTKAGTRQYHGEINFIFRDSIFNARNAFSPTRPPEQRCKFEGEVGGPVFHSKKTSFLISADHDVEDVESTVFALGPSGTIQQNVPSPTHNTLVYGRIDHTINDKNNFSISASYHGRQDLNQGVGGLTLPEAGYNQSFSGEKVRFNETAIFTPNLLNEFHLMLAQYRRPTVSLSDAPQIDVLGAFVSGGAQVNQLLTKHHFALTDIATWAHAKHQVEWGFEIPDWARRGLNDNQNFGGTFTFSNLADYAAGKPLTYTLQQGDGHLIYWQKMLAAFAQDSYRLKPNLMLSGGLRWDWEDYFPDAREFAPRLALAWSPRKSPKTVIRGGVGIFNDRAKWDAISDLLLFNGQRLQSYVITNPSYPDPFGPGMTPSAIPPNIVELEPNFRMPYMFMDSIEVERQITKGATLSATWEDGRTVHAFRSRDLNAPLPPLYAARPDPAIGMRQQYEAAGRSQWDALHIQFRGQLGRYFTGMARYRLGWSYNDTSGINSFPANQYDLSGEWGRSIWDRRHRFALLGVFNQGKLLNLGVSLWLHSGGPYDITTGTDPYNDGLTLARPPGVSRNTGQAPGYAEVDVRWEHDFPIEKKRKDSSPVFTVAVGAFNVLNTVNYEDVVGNLSSPLFGKPVDAEPARRLQFSARFQF